MSRNGRLEDHQYLGGVVANLKLDEELHHVRAFRPGSVSERWASFVFYVLHAESDPKTIGTWAKAVGVSRTALSECCRLVHVSPHDARDFARLIRAILRSGATWQPETALDVADARTLKKLLARSGLPHTARTTPTLQEFFARQRWIPPDNPGVVALLARLGIRSEPPPL